MNKQTFCAILESALLNFDGMTKEEIVQQGIESKYVEIGIKLCNYLKSIKSREIKK
jgi:hypothetical protein